MTFQKPVLTFPLRTQGLESMGASTQRLHSSSFWGSYLEVYKVTPKRNLLSGLWVVALTLRSKHADQDRRKKLTYWVLEYPQ